jgi:aryl-alcohol dehydrogenase-like predicted oxidoreductase
MTTVGSAGEGAVLRVSKLVLGTMTFGDTVDETTAGEMIDAALESGIDTIDTANVYAAGVAEEMLGRLLKGRHDEVLLASKAGMPHPDCGPHAPLSPKGLRNSLEASLRRLDVESLDLFYLHQPDRATPLEATLSTVADLASEGKVKALGVSNFAAWQIGDLITTAARVGAPRPLAAQQLYNLVARRLEEEYLEFAASHQLYTIVYNPLAGGLLAGQLSFDSKPSQGRFGGSRISDAYTKRYWVKELFAAVDRLSGIAAEAGITPAALALRWLAFRDGVGSVVLGSSRLGHLREDIDAVSAGPLDVGVVEACDAVGADLRGPMPAYNR